jgi:hypothetical protein
MKTCDLVRVRDVETASEVIERIRQTKRFFAALNVVPPPPPIATARQVRVITKDQMAKMKADRDKQRETAWAEYMERCRERAQEDLKTAPNQHLERDWLIVSSAAGFDHIHLKYQRPPQISRILYIKRIIAWCERRYNLHPGEIVGSRRNKFAVKARHLAIQIVGHSEWLRTLSLPQIGAYFGGRDHTSILHALKKAPSYKARLVQRKEKDRLRREAERLKQITHEPEQMPLFAVAAE